RGFDDPSADRDYAASFAEAGLAEAGEAPDVVAKRVRALAIWPELVAALDDWAAVTRDDARRAWLLQVARSTDPGPRRHRFRDAEVWKKRAELEQLAREADLAQQSPRLLAVLGKFLLGQQGDASPVLAVARRHPQDFWLNFELGNALAKAKREEALGYYQT